jgi:hypothetical protein
MSVKFAMVIIEGVENKVENYLNVNERNKGSDKKIELRTEKLQNFYSLVMLFGIIESKRTMWVVLVARTVGTINH